MRVLDNEIEILRTSVENKERLLQKCALVQSHKVMERDTLRQDFGKQVHMQSELSAELEQQVMQCCWPLCAGNSDPLGGPRLVSVCVVCVMLGAVVLCSVGPSPDY